MTNKATCGAQTRSVGTCKAGARHGYRTLPHARRSAPQTIAKAKERAQLAPAAADVARLGLHRDIHPAEALIELVQWTAGDDRGTTSEALLVQVIRQVLDQLHLAEEQQHVVPTVVPAAAAPDPKGRVERPQSTAEQRSRLCRLDFQRVGVPIVRATCTPGPLPVRLFGHAHNVREAGG